MKKKGLEFVFEVGCYFYKRTPFSKPNWVLEDGEGEWWMVEHEDIIYRIPDPVCLAITSKRTEYRFDTFKEYE